MGIIKELFIEMFNSCRRYPYANRIGQRCLHSVLHHGDTHVKPVKLVRRVKQCDAPRCRLVVIRWSGQFFSFQRKQILDCRRGWGNAIRKQQAKICSFHNRTASVDATLSSKGWENKLDFLVSCRAVHKHGVISSLTSRRPFTTNWSKQILDRTFAISAQFFILVARILLMTIAESFRVENSTSISAHFRVDEFNLFSDDFFRVNAQSSTQTGSSSNFKRNQTNVQTNKCFLHWFS